MSAPRVIDSHVHFWNIDTLEYPWLTPGNELTRAFLPADYSAATAGVPVEKIVFVEANPRPNEAAQEVYFVEALREEEPRISGIVPGLHPFLPGLEAAVEQLSTRDLVRGFRHNIQGHPPGYCLRPEFVEMVRLVGSFDQVFDLCATHDQLADVLELARSCPDTALVLDHCGKPAIRSRLLDPWREHITGLAGLDHVSCKLSGLLTEADENTRGYDDLYPYAAHVAEAFGPLRLMYGSDWPVLTRGGTYRQWYEFTVRFTRDWSPQDREAFYRGTAERVYGV